MSRRLPWGRLAPSAHPIYPEPTSMARLNDLTWIIMDAADEYDGLSDELTSAADFAAWLDLEVRRAGASRAGMSDDSAPRRPPPRRGAPMSVTMRKPLGLDAR